MKIIKKVYNLFKKKYMPPRDTRQVIRELSDSTGSPDWEPIEGVQSLTTVNRQAPSGVSFNMGSGLLVKGFINRRTGEIRLFPAKMFGFPDTDI
jgi:hypothetical protein